MRWVVVVSVVLWPVYALAAPPFGKYMMDKRMKARAAEAGPPSCGAGSRKLLAQRREFDVVFSAELFRVAGEDWSLTGVPDDSGAFANHPGLIGGGTLQLRLSAPDGDKAEASISFFRTDDSGHLKCIDWVTFSGSYVP
jgi:hypothetical protein